MTAYKSGCKGMTIYREGSRSGILVSDKKKSFDYMDAIKRPKEVDCDIYHKIALKRNWMILVGKYEGKPYELAEVITPSTKTDNQEYSPKQPQIILFLIH
jgi:ribonucleoside-diphosphate reductase alpha chain